MSAVLLPMLGPFARAIFEVLKSAETNRDDILKPGRDLHYPLENKYHPLGYFACSLLVFRGVSLHPTVVQKWTAMQAKTEYEHQIDDIEFVQKLILLVL